MATRPGEGAKFCLQICTELCNRGVAGVLMAVCDGLKGLPEAIEAVLVTEDGESSANSGLISYPPVRPSRGAAGLRHSSRIPHSGLPHQ